MASFARDLVLPCRQALLRRPPGVGILPTAWTASAPRCFTTTLRLRVAAEAAPKKPPAPATTKPTAPPADVRPPPAPSRYAFIKRLAAKQTPTTLYEAPSHFWFYFSCWTSGLSIVAWTALTGPASVHQPEDVPQWVGVVFGASYAILGAMGFYLISKTPNLVASIRLLPPPAAWGAAMGTGPRAAVAAAAATPQLEVTVKRMLPFLQPKAVTTSLDKVALQSRFSLPEEYVPDLRRVAWQREDEARRRELHRFDMEHLLTMPFRRVGRALVSMFRGVRAAWSDMGFGVIRVDGKQYKVDVTKGFAHDGFRTLERLVAVGFK